MSDKQPKGIADFLGSGYAHLQHGIDRLIGWGFSKMKESGTEEEKVHSFESPYLNAAARAGKGALRFVGNMGEAYFHTYEELKKKNTKK